MQKPGCVYQRNPNGTSNPKYVDLLEEDKPVSGQKFVCVSFVSPENILKQKNHFFFQEFLKHYDFAKSVEKQSKIYKNQLKECQKSLNRNKFIIF